MLVGRTIQRAATASARLSSRAFATTAARHSSAAPKTERTDHSDLLAAIRSAQIAEQYETKKEMKTDLFSYGSDSHSIDPGRIFNNPLPIHKISLDILLSHQTHLGHSTTRWNPETSPYIFGSREGTHIISLDVTAAHLRRAGKVVSMVAQEAGLILFVGTRPGQERTVLPAAQIAGGSACYLSRKYLPGTLTNRFEITPHCPVRVVNALDEEVPELAADLDRHPPILPDLIICLNPNENRALLQEATQLSIPTIGIIDTDANPGWVTYQIPANDDSPRSVQLIGGALALAAKEGREKRLAFVREHKMSPYKTRYAPQSFKKNLITKKQAGRAQASRSVVMAILDQHSRKQESDEHIKEFTTDGVEVPR